jgi:hypothetical protein
MRRCLKKRGKCYNVVVMGRGYKRGGRCRCLLLLEKEKLCTVLCNGERKQTFGGKIY